MSLKAKIKESVDLPSKIVTVPQWGCDILVRGLSAGGRSWWVGHVRTLQKRAEHIKDDGAFDMPTSDYIQEYVCPLLHRTLYDPETVTRIFDTVEETIEVLSDKSEDALKPLISTSLALSGLGPEVEKEIKDDF